MSATATSLAEKFASQEYISFKETVDRASLDNKLVIKNQHVTYGKHKVKIPNFVNANEVIEYLEAERVKHLLDYNDVYEKIIVSDKPQAFKTSYEKLVTLISNLEVLIDEIHAFIESRNVSNKTDIVERQLKDVATKISETASVLEANGVFDTIKVKQLVNLFHEGTRLHNAHIEAQHEPYFDYVIYDLPTKEKQKVVSASKASKRSGLTMLSKVKPTIKNLMIDKLDIST
jgi:hypothetical protein